MMTDVDHFLAILSRELPLVCVGFDPGARYVGVAAVGVNAKRVNPEHPRDIMLPLFAAALETHHEGPPTPSDLCSLQHAVTRFVTSMRSAAVEQLMVAWEKPPTPRIKAGIGSLRETWLMAGVIVAAAADVTGTVSGYTAAEVAVALGGNGNMKKDQRLALFARCVEASPLWTKALATPGHVRDAFAVATVAAARAFGGRYPSECYHR